MGLPIVLLFVFLGVACSLEGASDGIQAYVGEWDMSVLTEQGEVWSVACSQVFFSIGLTFGIMTAYGSHCKQTDPAVKNSTIVASMDSLFAFIAGFAVFASLGNAAYTSGVDDISQLPYSGFGLVFGTWPVVFNSLPGGIHWVRLIFFNLFLLGIDSAFSFLEAFIAVLHDTGRYCCFFVCTVGRLPSPKTFDHRLVFADISSLLLLCIRAFPSNHPL
jgi:SNF family Na+-dependent transporter